MRKLVLIRKLSQTFFLILFIYVLWSTTYPLKGIISPQIIFKIDPLIVFLTALSERLIIPGMIFSLAMIILTLLLGRFFCGWVCPTGTMIDVAGALFRRKKKDLSSSTKRKISAPKFFILGLIIFLALAGIQAAWVLDPIVTGARVVSLNLIPAATVSVDKIFQFSIQKFNLYGGFYDFYRTLKSGLLGIDAHFFSNSLITLILFLLICSGSFFILRLWCRMLCPLGAFYALNARPALLERRVKSCTSAAYA